MSDARLKISLCYMIKNEAVFLKASLDSIVDHVEELVIFDTGSTDQSVEIAEQFRPRVPRFLFKKVKWTNHFSEMRNAIALEATQPWVFFVDGDEILDESSLKALKLAITKNEIACYSIIQRNYTWNESTESVIRCSAWPPALPMDSRPLYYFDNWMERLYQPAMKIVYEGRIHESLIPSLQRQKVKYEKLNLILHHYGRLKPEHEAKIEYYLKLTEQKCKEDPENAAAWIEWMITLSESGESKRAYEIATQTVRKFSSEPEVYKVAFQLALRAEDYVAGEDWLRQYLKMRPEDFASKAQLSTALLYQKKFDAVLHEAGEILKRDPENFISHVNLAVVFFEEKKWNDARHHIRAALKHRPNDKFLNEALAKIGAMIQTH